MAREVSVIGLDIAKSVLQIHGVDREGRAVLRKRLRRGQMGEFFSQLKPCVIGIEATQGAHYWTRVLSAYGHTVRLISPHFVKPFLKSRKNDANDAGAICEATGRPSMRFVPAKSVEQQDLQGLHRIHSRMIGCRTQLGNQIRGLLAKYGIRDPGSHEPSAKIPAAYYRRRQSFAERIRQVPVCFSLRRTLRAGRTNRRAGEADAAGFPAERTVPAALGHRRCGSGYCHRRDRCDRGWQIVSKWPEVRRLDRPGAATAFQRRETAIVRDHEARRSLPPHAADTRSPFCDLPRT
jgi:transposase